MIEDLFVTPVYRAALDPAFAHDALLASCLAIAKEDDAGHAWCEENGFPGYTSYASLADLPWRDPVFEDLIKALDHHIGKFSAALEFDLEGRALICEDIWINILPEGGIHTSHVHPHSVISGTIYVALPETTNVLKLEDPRLAMMMAAPARKPDARRALQQFIYIAPEVGDVVLWESWLRHEVPMNMTEDDRISISFNYRWET